jgi:hypothetical protein
VVIEQSSCRVLEVTPRFDRDRKLGARPSPGNGRRALIRNCAFLVNRDPLQRSSNLFLVLAALSGTTSTNAHRLALVSECRCLFNYSRRLHLRFNPHPLFRFTFPALSCATPCTNNMAEVLSRSRDDQSQSYYIQPASNSSSLKRSHSSRTSLLVGSPPKTSHRTASEPSFEHVGSLKRSLASSGSLAASRQSYSDLSHVKGPSRMSFPTTNPSSPLSSAITTILDSPFLPTTRSNSITKMNR